MAEMPSENVAVSRSHFVIVWISGLLNRIVYWEKRRNELRAQLRRLNYQFEHGLIEEKDVPDYEKKAQH